MDQLDAMRVFVRVVERRSFIKAAHDLALPRSRVSDAVKQLEIKLGNTLLTRNTRQVTPTTEGEEYYGRSLAILGAIDEADFAAGAVVPASLLRIDVHGTFARQFLLPGLPEFLNAHAGIRLHIGEGDRLVDLVEEGVDCVIRIGEPADSGLIGRRLGMLSEGTFASREYLRRFGTPASPDDLHGHRMIGFVSSATRAVIPLEFTSGSEVKRVTLPTSVTVSAADTFACLAQLGFGIVQVPRYRVAQELEAGALVEILDKYPPTSSSVFLLYPEGRQLSPRVRQFMDWATEEIGRRLGQA